MSKYVAKPVTIDAVHTPYNEWADNPGTFGEVPAWLTKMVDEKRITPEFKGEDYWYYLISNEGQHDQLADPDSYIVYDETADILQVVAAKDFELDWELIPGQDDAPAAHLCPKCGLPVVDGDSVLPTDTYSQGKNVLAHKTCPDAGLVAG